ncbi:MAG TPA: GPP34 family phosphoprotein [Bacteroidales bacterium]|nr:GPP34 family phosphoprotein [Bacteroidales bacterium]HPS63829.1 GPP34 family phosphoprotein [Bacteroidales bacterium]
MDKSEKKGDLTLLQRIVLLALDDKGWFGPSEHKLKFGLVGAILFELHERGRIRLQNDKVVVLNAKSTDDVILDRVLNVIKSGKKEHSLRWWIQRIAYKKLLLRKTVLKQLIQKKIISREEYSLMVVFYQTKFPLINPALKKQLQESLGEKLLSGGMLDNEEMMLLVVMSTCRMIRKNFRGSLQYLKVRARINEIVQFRIPGNESEMVMKNLHLAINRAIMASNVSLHV